MNERGNISFVFTFVLLAVLILFMFVLLSPALQNYSVKVFAAAEPLIEDANTTAQGIEDSRIRTAITNSLQDSKDSSATQIEILNFFFQYAWLFVIALTAFILLLFSRFLVERNVGGAV